MADEDAEITKEKDNRHTDGQQRGEMPFRAWQLQKAARKHTYDGAHDETPQRENGCVTSQRRKRVPAERSQP